MSDDLQPMSAGVKPWPVMSPAERKHWDDWRAQYDRETVRDRIIAHRREMLNRELGERWAERTFGTYREMPGNRAALARATAILESGFTLGAAFSGEVGNGKTHLAAAIVHAAIECGKTARFITSSRLIERIIAAERNQSRDDMLWSYTHADVLAIDDLGKESQTSWSLTTLFDAINSRYETGRPIIVTCNVPISGMVAFYASRAGAQRTDVDESLAPAMVDRIAEMCGGRDGFCTIDAPSQRWNA